MMTDGDSSETNFQVLHRLYQRIKKLSKTDNTANDEAASTEVKKEINDLIDRVIEKINAFIAEDNSQNLRLFAMKMTMFYERSKLLINLGDVKLSQETLITALNMIHDVVSKPEIIFLAFRIINHYAYLLSKQCDYETSRAILEFGETIYNNAKKETPVIEFFTNDDLFAPGAITAAASTSSGKLERVVTSNLQMLGFIYNKQELHDKFAAYHHEVLRRQLEMRDEEPIMWATKSARLASYFLSKHRFKEARHHLAAAVNVLHDHEREITAMEDLQKKVKKLHDWQKNFADIAKYWVKYGLVLFSVSKSSIVSQFCIEPNHILKRMWAVPFKKVDKNSSSNSEKTTFETCSRIRNNVTQNVDQGDSSFVDRKQQVMVTRETSGTLPQLIENVEESGSVNRDTIHIEEYSGPDLIFASLDLRKYENQVTTLPIETTADARALFLYTHGWLKKVKSFYAINEHPIEYVNAILDLSELYRHLAFYEEDIERDVIKPSCFDVWSNLTYLGSRNVYISPQRTELLTSQAAILVFESQYGIQKLRADALETLSTVLREIQPQCYMAVTVELLRELAEVQLEMLGLNLRRIYGAEEAVTDTSEVTLHKMEALADIHSRLEQFDEDLDRNIERVPELSLLKADEAEDAVQHAL